ncbi:MAG: hypothetical protein AAGF01_04930 [Cyanobacteria bacterium P01_G01_bin.38]
MNSLSQITLRLCYLISPHRAAIDTIDPSTITAPLPNTEGFVQKQHGHDDTDHRLASATASLSFLLITPAKGCNLAILKETQDP